MDLGWTEKVSEPQLIIMSNVLIRLYVNCYWVGFYECF